MIYLGIDSGTQSTKTIALDFDSGEILASAQAAYSLIEGLPAGHLEQHPQDWVHAVEKSVGACLEQLGVRRNEVQGIGVSGQQHGLVVLDELDEVIRPAKLWCDTSTTAECEAFGLGFGGTEGLVELAGNAVLPGYTAPKLLWLKRNEPDHFASVRSVLLPHDYLNFWLTGEKRMEYGDASGTALLDVRKREWCVPLCDFIEKGFANRLPELGSSTKPAGILRPELAGSWGLSPHVLVSSGGGDNMMGAIGTGNIEEGIFTVSLGTSGTLYACANNPVVDRRGEVAAFCDSTDRWLPLVCTMNVTVATETIRRLFGWNLQQFSEAASGAAAGSEGVTFLPYLNGERTPNLPHGSGVFHGLTTKNSTPSNLARSAVEGATLGLAYGLERFRELGLEPREVRLTGGGSNSKLWREIATSIFGVQTVCLETAEGAALGAAIQAAWCDPSQSHNSLSQLTTRLVQLDESTRVTPDEQERTIYAELLSRFKDLTQNLKAGGHL
ncbi:MAG: xylulokinase [Chthoniobacteraceae bacterium]